MKQLAQLDPVSMARLGADYLIGNRPDPMQRQVIKDVHWLAKHIPGVSRGKALAVGKFAGRVAPALSAVGNVADVIDIATGDESFGNRAMDVVSMGAGGTIGGMIGGPLGASVGASTGKAVSDGLQGLFGGGKSAEERKLEEALNLLQGRGVI